MIGGKIQSNIDDYIASFTDYTDHTDAVVNESTTMADQTALMAGGKILGQGTYGCVIDKPLTCINNYVPPQASVRNITKIAKPYSLQPEVKAAKILNQIPFANKYFLLLKGHGCKLPQSVLEKEPELKKCDILQRVGIAEVEAVRMSFGGVSIEDYKVDPVKFDVHRFVKNILEAGSLITLHGIIHRDLHRGNILMDENGYPHIIDFGLSIYKKDALKMDDFLFGFDPKYDQEPPEMTLWNAVEDNMEMFFWKKKNLAGPIKDIFAGKKIIQISQTFNHKTIDQLKTDFDTYIDESKTFIDKDFAKWWEIYWSKFDAWSIGGTICKTIFFHMQQPAFKYNVTYNKYKTQIHQIITGLLDVNPKSRLDLVEALAIIDPNSIVINKYGSSWLKQRKQQRKL